MQFGMFGTKPHLKLNKPSTLRCGAGKGKGKEFVMDGRGPGIAVVLRKGSPPTWRLHMQNKALAALGRVNFYIKPNFESSLKS